jgi:hypothetical protein
MVTDSTFKKPSAEELLKPRYKLIGDYPGCSFEVGTVLEPTEEGELFSKTGGYSSSATRIMLKDAKRYPHLVEELRWWEERTDDEMPEYLRWNYKPDVDHQNMKNYVAKVEGWQQAHFGVVTHGQVTATKFWIPITETEYNTLTPNLQPEDKKR